MKMPYGFFMMKDNTAHGESVHHCSTCLATSQSTLPGSLCMGQKIIVLVTLYVKTPCRCTVPRNHFKGTHLRNIAIPGKGPFSYNCIAAWNAGNYCELVLKEANYLETCPLVQVLEDQINPIFFLYIQQRQGNAMIYYSWANIF